jgi:NAD(P)H-quinone oxidoreductase subunit N
MALITTGGTFIRDLETHGALACFAPLEGGYEGRYIRRARARGYEALTYSARGLGDPTQYLTAIHGMRPPHLGKQNIGMEGAVGQTQFVQPILAPFDHLPQGSKGGILWLLEGYVLTNQELAALVSLTRQRSNLKIVIEMGGARSFRWEPLSQLIQAA